MVKRQLNHFITDMKRSFGPFDYFWFLEFQERGAPHLHLGLTLPAPQSCDRELMATIWSHIAEQGNWAYTELAYPYEKKDAGFGMNTRDSVFRQHRRKNVWEKIRKPDGAMRYCLMYAKKHYQKIVPENFRDVGRFWYVSSGVTIPSPEIYSSNEKEVRELLPWLGRRFENWPVLPKTIFYTPRLTKANGNGNITNS